MENILNYNYNLEPTKTVLKVETTCLTTGDLCLLFNLIISDYNYYKRSYENIEKIIPKYIYRLTLV